MLCRSCRAYNRAGATFCVSCGAAMSQASGRRFISIGMLRSLLVLALLISCVAIVYSPLGQRLGLLTQLLSRMGGQQTVVTRETVVLGIQSMSQLATAKYTIQTIVEIEDRGFF